MDKNEIENRKFIDRVSMYDEAIELVFGEKENVKVTCLKNNKVAFYEKYILYCFSFKI